MIEYDLEMQESVLTNYIVVTDKPKSSRQEERARESNEIVVMNPSFKGVSFL
jgi:hypothetical protein